LTIYTLLFLPFYFIHSYFLSFFFLLSVNIYLHNYCQYCQINEIPCTIFYFDRKLIFVFNFIPISAFIAVLIIMSIFIFNHAFIFVLIFVLIFVFIFIIISTFIIIFTDYFDYTNHYHINLMFIFLYDYNSIIPYYQNILPYYSDFFYFNFYYVSHILHILHNIFQTQKSLLCSLSVSRNPKHGFLHYFRVFLNK
jgi:hypothetical protein